MADVEELIRQLNSLHRGDAIVGQLIAAGEAAIGPLRRFLLEGRPASLYEPRRWAVEALGGLRANDVLLEYLHSEPSISDPMVRMGEDVVRDAAIRELASSRTEGFRLELLELSRRRLTPALVEALGEFGRVEDAPVLDRALEDDVCRPAAEDSLRRIGAPAIPALALSAATPLPDRPSETSSSIRRRRSALKLLAELGPDGRQWIAIESALEDPDAQISILAAQLGLSIAPPSLAAACRTARDRSPARPALGFA